MNNKFSIGENVITKVTRRGSYEPSILPINSKVSIQKIEKVGDSFEYTCGYDGYHFKEDELMSIDEYSELLKEM